MQVQTVSTGISARLSVCQAILASSYSPVLRLLLFKPSDPKINSDTSERCEVALCTPLPCSLSITISLSHASSVCISRSVFLYDPHFSKTLQQHPHTPSQSVCSFPYPLPHKHTHTYTWYNTQATNVTNPHSYMVSQTHESIWNLTGEEL